MNWRKITDTMPPCDKTVLVRFYDGSIATASRGLWEDHGMWESVGAEVGGTAFTQDKLTHYADVPETPTEW